MKDTSEYADLSDAEIIKAAATLNQTGTQGFNNLNRTAGAAAPAGSAKPPSKSNKPKMNNDWIPTEAVRAIIGIRDRFNGDMSETCISQILYELNMIWRQIMRKENEAIKKKLTG